MIFATESLRRLASCVFFTCFMLFSVRPSAALAQRYYVPQIPLNLDMVDMYLITVGVGHDVASRWGHTGLRVHDRQAGMDVVFNWGTFNFAESNFVWKFFRGALTYTMAVRTYERDLQLFHEDKRAVWQDKLNLTAQQKLKLMEKIAWNARPENRLFPYQYWFKNCSTIPRDYLDEALDGKIKNRYYQMATSKRHRDYVRSNLASIPFGVLLLDIAMNSNIDQPISAWDEMFLPAKLREHLASLPALDNAGQPIPGKMLLSESQKILDFPEVFAPAISDSGVLVLPCAVLFILAAVFITWSRRLEHKLAQRIRATGFRLLGLGALMYGVLAGIIGTMLLCNWLLSGHPDAKHSTNLLLFWPLDFIFAVWGWRWLRQASAFKDRWLLPHAGKVFLAMHLLGAFILMAATAGGWLSQDVWSVALWFAPLLVCLGLVVATLGFLGLPETSAQVSDQLTRATEGHPSRSLSKRAR